jgi:hypothetical protein
MDTTRADEEATKVIDQSQSSAALRVFYELLERL